MKEKGMKIGLALLGYVLFALYAVFFSSRVMAFEALNPYRSSEMWLEITRVIGWLADVACVIVVIAGIAEMIKGKGIKKMDKDILCLWALYILCALLRKEAFSLCVFVSLGLWLGRKAPMSRAFPAQLMCVGLGLAGLITNADIVGDLLLSFALIMTFVSLLPKAEPVLEEEEETADWAGEACMHLKELQAEGKLGGEEKDE